MSVFEIPCGEIKLAILSPDQAALVQEYYLQNQEHLEPWEPERVEGFYDLNNIKARLARSAQEFHDGVSYRFAVVDCATGRMIGSCGFNNIVRGVFQACHLGYSIAADFQGKGLMFRALQAGIDYMFGTVGLHRIMANHMPRNERSARLLQRLGFEREGFAKSYLKIAGKWEDHVLNSLVNRQETR